VIASDNGGEIIITLGNGNNDTVSAGNGSTVTIGNGNNDTVSVGNGSTITAGKGIDTFVIGASDVPTPSVLTGSISGFGVQDKIDLPGIAFGAQTTLAYTENSTNTGINLTVSDGTHTANLALLGAIASTFVISSDGNGGTMITDPALDQHTKLTTPHA
jgi:hypothetical protein